MYKQAQLPELKAKPFVAAKSKYQDSALKRALQIWGPKSPKDGGTEFLFSSCRDSCEVQVCGMSSSTYPLRPGAGGRDGDPIADAFHASCWENRFVFSLADGCNLGQKSSDAALKASSSFCEYLTQRILFNDTCEAGKAVEEAIHYAHTQLVEGRANKDIWEVGTTSLCGGVLMELKADEGSKWGLVAIGVGESKIYHYSPKAKKGNRVVDITANNRLHARDERDPGGRIGPYVDDGKPDLRNLQLYYFPCQPGDYLLFLTRGISANLHPRYVGKSTQDLKIKFPNWDDCRNDVTAQQAVTQFTNSLLEGIIEEAGLSPQSVAKRLIQYCNNLTQHTRNLMASSPSARPPTDYTQYPGRLDHTTCLVAQVGAVRTPPREGPPTPDVWEFNLFLPQDMKNEETAENASVGNSSLSEAEERAKEETFWANFERTLNRNKKAGALAQRAREEMRDMDLLYLNVKTGEVGLKIRPSDSYETGGQRKLVVDAQTHAKEKDGLIIESWRQCTQIPLTEDLDKALVAKMVASTLAQNGLPQLKVVGVLSLIQGIIPEEDTYFVRQTKKSVRLKELVSATTPREALTGPGAVVVIDSELDIIGMGNVVLGTYRHICVLGLKAKHVRTIVKNHLVSETRAGFPLPLPRFLALLNVGNWANTAGTNSPSESGQ